MSAFATNLDAHISGQKVLANTIVTATAARNASLEIQSELVGRYLFTTSQFS